jgi:DNA polymerase-3 subunit gamma/tau
LTNGQGVLSFPLLHRLWQLLLKGHEEVRASILPLECLRNGVAARDARRAMPDPGELARMLKEGGVPSQASAPVAVPTMGGECTCGERGNFPDRFRALVDALDRGGHPNVAATLHDVVRLVSYAPPRSNSSSRGRCIRALACRSQRRAVTG